MIIRKILVAGLLLASVAVQSAEESVPAALKAAVQALNPGASASNIEQTPISGLYQVILQGHIYYFSADGRYVVDGDLLDIKSGKNLTNRLREQVRIDALAEIDESQMIVFEPKQVKHTMTVFTDIDCGYCRKLHREMDTYTDLGIRVRYMAYPRAGKGSPSYNKAISVWCADEPKKAMTDAKASKPVEKKTCEHPVDDQIALGESFGIRGTPALILDNGKLLPGYVPAKRLLAIFNKPNELSITRKK